MTTPGPEQMRALADVVHWSQVHAYAFPTVDVIAYLRAAANDVEWLRIQRDNSDRRAIACVEAMQKYDTENSLLRAVVKDAPHDERCEHWTPEGCTCWKAEAL